MSVFDRMINLTLLQLSLWGQMTSLQKEQQGFTLWDIQIIRNLLNYRSYSFKKAKIENR